MTSRQVYEGTLVELNKVNAPSLLLEDFNYLFNKAIYQYINKKYNIYDVNQQSTDDMRVLKATAILPVRLVSSKYGTGENVIAENALYGATFEATLPSDYLHLLNCVCNFRVNQNFKCYDANTYVQFGATRLTGDIWSQIIHNFYMRPSYKKPYYYIHNVNQIVKDPNNSELNKKPAETKDVPSNPYVADQSEHGLGIGTDTPNSTGYQTVTGGNSENLGSISSPTPNLSRSLLVHNDLVEKNAGVRYGNASEVRLEIRYGKDSSVFKLENVYVDYIKTPQHIRLTQEQLDLTEDTSQMMEFPDYVCQEIINELVKLCMENASDPRLQTNLAVNQTIANPAQQQAQTQQ